MNMIEKVLNLVENIDINNTKQALVLALAMMVIVIRYISSLLTRNIELIFMKKKEERKKELASFFLLFILFTMVNCIYTLNASYVALEVLALLCVVIFCTIKIITRWVKNKLLKKKEGIKNKKQNYNFQLMMLIIIFSILIYFVSTIAKINIYSLSVIASVAETVVLLLYIDGTQPKKSRIVIHDEKSGKVLYVYKKVNEEYLLCGDFSDMEQANKIIAFKIEKLYSEDYYLTLNKNEQETKENSN